MVSNESRLIRIAELLARETNSAQSEITGTQACSGGCIHRAERVQLADGRSYFIKSNKSAHSMFALEADGLQALARNESLRIPGVIAIGVIGDQEDCLILEFIEPGTPSDDFYRCFGRAFAALHREQRHDQFGWKDDNFLGSTPQPNGFFGSWITFFREQRLESQLHLARRNGCGSRELFKLGDRVCNRLDNLLAATEEQASLLHGDLWSGNFLVDTSGQAVIFDPAVYYGHREADLAMPLLFGGFSSDFFEGYQEFWPLEEGWQDRLELYKLYHLLNHLNLFGGGYLDSCLDILRRFA